MPRSGAPAAPTPTVPRKPSAKAPTRKPAATPAALIRRVNKAIAAELAEIEAIIDKPKARRSKARLEGEKRARTLASLARTLSEITRLRVQQRPKGRDDDSDAVPRDLDEFRRTLQERLGRLVAAAADDGAADDGVA